MPLLWAMRISEPFVKDSEEGKQRSDCFNFAIILECLSYFHETFFIYFFNLILT